MNRQHEEMNHELCMETSLLGKRDIKEFLQVTFQTRFTTVCDLVPFCLSFVSLIML